MEYKSDSNWDGKFSKMDCSYAMRPAVGGVRPRERERESGAHCLVIG